MTENYKILNCTENSTMEEITENYNKLREQYTKDMFKEGEEGAKAAKNLNDLNNAFNEIKKERESSSQKNENTYENIKKFISQGDLTKAQFILDNFDQRDAEWHYLQSVVYYKKSWYNESKKQLEFAISMDENNEKYKKEYNALNEFINSKQNQNTNQQNSRQSYEQSQPQMGGESCLQSCCECFICNALLNCFCNC